ncbi:coiled-coil domain-containing protein [Micromonospora endolithica]|uniref:ARB-07466-like C-terminal domain-containing protein n=1 Tax=Micromonospora endolithica TaxID=230091 RepID=A0A3A9ZSA4_9ACTN|nr:hypothetical protein [Micromonospora endolithica]RKN51013.1 hypothetical protein D7223_04585 [Micromonospora endolithica]TWJ20196.1 hypothetical protein JD76_00291 [Micromonospora endolithica]
MPEVRHRATRTAALLVATLAVALGGAPVTATAAPAPATALAAPGQDEEGGTPALRDALEAASKGYLDAKRALDTSVQRQKQLAAEVQATDAQLAERTQQVGEIAGLAYRTGRLSAASALLNSGSPDGFMDRAAALDTIAANEDRALRELQQARETANRAKLAVEIEIREQTKQKAVMAKRKQQAERALTVANQRAAAADSGDSVRGTSSKTARPAPRNSDGSYPSESCSVNDPTPANGCITPRTLHALNQAKAAGFTRYVSCYRPGGSGEHPKGRACDFAAQKGGFGGDATGGDRTYGNNLAAYFVNNSDRLAVLYVIWYRQIWLPSSGWKSYSGANGDPSSDHTNHVHLSVY